MPYYKLTHHKSSLMLQDPDNRAVRVRLSLQFDSSGYESSNCVYPDTLGISYDRFQRFDVEPWPPNCYLEQNFYNLERLCILCNLIVYQDGYLKENFSILIKAKMFL